MFQRRKKGGEGRGERPKANFRDLGRAIRYLGRYQRMTIFAYLALFISTGAQLMVPQLVQNVLDAVTNGMIAKQISGVPANFLPVILEKLSWSAEQFDTFTSRPEVALYWAIGLIVVFAIARGAFAFAQTFIAEQVSQGVAFDFRNELFEKIQRLSFSYHDRNRTGQLMIRATDDVEKVRGFIGQGLLMAVQALVLLVGTLTILLFTNFALTLVILPILPLALVLFMVFGAVAQPLFAAVQAKLSKLNTILQENLAGIKVVKAFVREPQEQAKFHVAAEDLMNQGITVGKVFSFLFPFIFLLANLGQAAVLYYGGVQIIDSTLTFGEWQKFSLYLIYVFFPIGQLGFIISQMSQASASATRIFEILNAQNDVVNKPNAQPLPAISGELAFENVTFRYFGSGDPVLSNISFAAAPGQTVALLGATGSGKSTVINLIPRFYDVSEGKLTIDGIDVRDVTLESLRSQIGIVLQETNLFTGSIRDNIAFGRPDATDEDVMAAAKAAAAHDFIVGFPEGYNTPVGERGSTLSGGQKQRVAIARALLLDPRILILDDSTSSVDLATEATIQRALDKLMKGRTSIVIAQRISTVRNADQIIVLEKGKVVGVGTHTDLMETNPIYAEIFSSQLVEDAVTDGDGQAMEAIQL